MRFLVFFISLTHFLFAQESNNHVYVQYSVTKSFMNYDASLIANSSNSLYVKGSKVFNFKDSTEQVDQENFDVMPKSIKTHTLEIYNSYSKNRVFLVSNNPNDNSKTISLDSVPKINWTLITGETKVISGLVCNKAKAIFRGSEIIAYYTLDIPIPFGPFKFKGLPGLILEVYGVNTNHEYRWTVNKIKYPFTYSNDIYFKADIYSQDIVSYRSLVEAFDEKLNNANRQMRAKSQIRGGTLTSNKRERVSIEQLYEWE